MSGEDPFNGNGVARELSKRIDSVEEAVNRLDDKFDRFGDKIHNEIAVIGGQVARVLVGYDSQQRKFAWRSNILPGILLSMGALVMAVLALVVAHV